LGPTAARATGYWFYLGVCAGVPVVAVLGAEYVVAVVGADRAVVPVVAVALVVVPALAVALGVRVAGAVQLGLTTLLLAAVVVVVAAAAPAATAERFTPFLSEGWSGVGSAVSLFVWAFAGWEVGTHVSADFRDPRRTIPAATGVALVVVGVAYLALQVTTVGVLGTDAGTGTVALLDLARVGAPGAGPVLVGVVAAVVTSGVLTAYLAAFANLGQALARDGDLPRPLAALAGRAGVPRRALAVTLALATGYRGAPRHGARPRALRPGPHEQHGGRLRAGHGGGAAPAPPALSRLVARRGRDGPDGGAAAPRGDVARRTGAARRGRGRGDARPSRRRARTGRRPVGPVRGRLTGPRGNRPGGPFPAPELSATVDAMPTWTDPGPVEFDAVVVAAGTRSGAFVTLPVDVLDLFGTRGRVPVLAAVDDVAYHASLVAYGGPHLLAVLRSVRAATGKDVGDTVHVSVRLDAGVSAVPR
ncbi:amino acid permease, partial [Cellulosimicrobium cellulans]|uniref:amino acid permease n=1 Tax=Cellulosimicrobium cellulans TaxID=1710 RepID=UPI001D16FB01